MFKEMFIWLGKHLYPRGRAFRVPEPLIVNDTYVTEDGTPDYTTEDGEVLVTETPVSVTGGILHRLHGAVAEVQNQVLLDAISILDSCVADNPNFTIEDCRLWYARLGIYDSGLVSREDMMRGINQKINYPGEKIYGRSNYLFIQDQLRAAGFDVYVYENRFSDGMGGWITKTPAEVLGVPAGTATLGSFDIGDLDLASAYAAYGVTLLVNYLEEEKDALFAIGANYRSTFFIAGATVADFATVPAGRKIEFRQLLLSLKPTQCVGILFVNYP